MYSHIVLSLATNLIFEVFGVSLSPCACAAVLVSLLPLPELKVDMMQNQFAPSLQYQSLEFNPSEEITSHVSRLNCRNLSTPDLRLHKLSGQNDRSR